MKITRQQRYEYRDLLIEKGVPEEIAVIASERPSRKVTLTGDAADLISRSFFWAETPEGHDFWRGVYLELGGNC